MSFLRKSSTFIGFAFLVKAFIFFGDAAGDTASKQKQLVGRIVNIDCAGSNWYEVVDKNGNIQHEESRLYAGDIIWIKHPNCKVTVGIGSFVQTLSSKDSPYSVLMPKVSLLDRVRAALGYPVEQQKDQVGVEIGQAIGRGVTPDDNENSEIAIPLLLQWQSQIAAGTRTLHLPWRGGEAPFKVTLTMKGKGEKALGSASELQSRVIRFEGLTFGPGIYLVTVEGRNGRPVQASFEAVNPSRLPTPPPELQTANPNSEFFQAGWLASRGHGEYVFEAYQQTVSLKNKDKDILRVQQMLEMGWRPSIE